MSIKHIPAILTDRHRERTVVRGIEFDESTHKLPDMIQHQNKDYKLDHHPGANTGPHNPPTYQETQTQKV